MEYRWHLRLWWRLGVVGINFSFLFLVSALPWQGLSRSQMLASPWLGLLRCLGSFSTYIHTHPWGHLLHTTLCQMGLAFSCPLRSPSVWCHPESCWEVGLVCHLFRVNRASLPHSALAFLLHPGPVTAWGPLAVTVKHISDKLSSVGRGVCSSLFVVSG